MGSRVTPAPLRLCPRRSRWLLAFLALVHLGALAIALSIPLPASLSWPVRLGLIALVAASAAWGVATHWWAGLPWSMIEARHDPDGWQLIFGSGEVARARLLGSSFVGQRLVVLNFALSGWRRRSLVLLPDSLDADVTRRLRAALRSGQGAGNAPEVLDK